MTVKTFAEVMLTFDLRPSNLIPFVPDVDVSTKVEDIPSSFYRDNVFTGPFSEVTIHLAFDLQSLISSSLSDSEYVCTIWRDSLTGFKIFGLQGQNHRLRRPSNIRSDDLPMLRNFLEV